MATVTVTDSLGNTFTYTIPVRIKTIQYPLVFNYLPVFRINFQTVDKSVCTYSDVVHLPFTTIDISDFYNHDFLEMQTIDSSNATFESSGGGGS